MFHILRRCTRESIEPDGCVGMEVCCGYIFAPLVTRGKKKNPSLVLARNDGLMVREESRTTKQTHAPSHAGWEDDKRETTKHYFFLLESSVSFF